MRPYKGEVPILQETSALYIYGLQSAILKIMFYMMQYHCYHMRDLEKSREMKGCQISA